MTATPTQHQTEEAKQAYQGMESRAKKLVQEFSDRLFKASGVLLLPNERAALVELTMLHSCIEWQKATEYAVLVRQEAKQ